MKGSAGVNNKKYIKATRFDSVYKTLLTEFYVNKFRNAKELEEEYGLKPSTFSETKDRIESAIPLKQEGNSAPITVSMFTENSGVRNPFFQLYTRCNDKDSEFYLYVLFAFWTVNQISVYISDNLARLADRDRRIVEQAMRDASSEEYNPVCCDKFACSSQRENYCKKCNLCLMTRLYNICGRYSELGSMTKKEIIHVLTGLFEKPMDAEKSVKRIARMDDHTLISKLRRLVEVGILKCDESNRYSLSDFYLSKILMDKNGDLGEKSDFNTRFHACVDFFSEIRPLGEIGYGISKKISYDVYRNPFFYKDRFVINTINDFNLIDILYAIEHDYVLLLNGKNLEKEVVAVPIQINISAKDGREVLIYYSPETHAVRSLWLNHIHKAEIVSLSMSSSDKTIFSKELKNAKSMVSYIWDFETEAIEGGNCSWDNTIPLTRVRLVMRFQEEYMKKRFFRELRGVCTVNEKQETYDLEVELLVSDENEVRSWIGAYSLCLRSFLSEKVEMNTASGQVSSRKERIKKSMPFEFSYDTLSDIKLPSSNMLFCPETGYAYKALSDLLDKTISSRKCPFDDLELVFTELTANTEKMSQDRDQEEQIRKRYTEPLRALFQGVEDILNHAEYSKILTSDLLEIPLTGLERNWLIEIMHEPMARLFLDEDEIRIIEEYLSLDKNARVFRFDSIHYCGCATNDIVVDTNTFRIALQAVIEARLVKCSYSNNKNADNNGIRYWDSMYYSNRQNTFRMNAYDLEKKSFRIDRLDSVTKLKLMDTVGSHDVEVYRKIILSGMQYGEETALADRKEVRIGLLGYSDEERMKFLHELSAYTINCRKIPASKRKRASSAKTEQKNIKPYLPQIGNFPDEVFDCVVTLIYPGNDYIEVVDTLCSYKNVFILEDRDIPKVPYGDGKRQRSVAREILERQQKYSHLMNNEGDNQ